MVSKGRPIIGNVNPLRTKNSNLGVFSFVLDKSPYAPVGSRPIQCFENLPQPQIYESRNRYGTVTAMAERSTSRTRSRSPLISARSLSASKYGRAYANQAESICNDFLEECRELEYQSERHFKPKEAEKSGKRMHNQFYV